MKGVWKYTGEIAGKIIFVNYTLHATKILTNKFIYIHNGIYPFHKKTPYYTIKRKFSN